MLMVTQALSCCHEKANVAVMLGTEPMPTLLSDLSNAKQVREWQMDASTAAGFILESISTEARIHCTRLLGVQLDKSTTPPAICVPCVAGKQHRDPFLSSEHTATRPMEIIYCDLRGPFNVRTYSQDLLGCVH
jgi:hypothetical protein